MTSVWHWVCLCVRLNKLCLAWGLSVYPSEQVMFGMGFVCLSVCTSYVHILYSLFFPTALVTSGGARVDNLPSVPYKDVIRSMTYDN